MFALGVASGGTAARGEEISGRFFVRSWQSDDGLPGNTVRSVAQAADGYLWIATAKGAVRFDGLRFTGFDVEPDAALSHISSGTIFARTDGDVWIATTRGGLLRWHDGRLARVWDEPSPGSGSVYVSLFSDSPNRFYLVRGAEVWRSADGHAPERVTRTDEVNEALRLNAAASASLHGKGVSGQPRDQRGRLWTILPKGGLSVEDEKGHIENIALPNIESGNAFSELCEDREGNLWVATGNSGLLQLRERRVEVLSVANGLAERPVRLVMQERTGTWWVGGKRGGVDRIQDRRVTHFDLGRTVAALHEDSHGMVWLATLDGSVFRYVDGAFAPVFPNTKVARINAFASDAGGGLWMGGSEHSLICWSGNTLTYFGPEQGFTAAKVTALTTDAADHLYVGASDGEVFQRNGARFESIASLGHQVTALLPDADGSLWIAALGGGLAHWRDGRLSHFGAREGLADLNLTCALDDQAGNLWLGSLGGIFRVPKSDLAAVEKGQREAANWLRLDRSDGMLSRECSGGFQSAGWRATDGELWIATVNGVARIRPDRFTLNKMVPPVVIEEARANGRPLPLARPPLQTGWGRARLEFRYTSLSLTTPEKAAFRIQLEGLENEWREVDTLRTASYEAVPPGRYRFRVLAANADRIWNETGAALAVEVLPHFWETGAFRLAVGALAALGATGAGWGISRHRLRRRLAALELRHARETERARIARDLHDDLGAGLTEISILAEDADAGQPERGCLGAIAGKAHALVVSLDEIVWAINPRHDTLASLADYFAAFAADFTSAAGLALRLDMEREMPEIMLETERRHSLFLALRESLNNAVKHSGASEIRLRLRAGNGRLAVAVEDNGRGFDPATVSQGEGLRNLRERLAALRGECHISSRVGEGTRVELSVPLA